MREVLLFDIRFVDAPYADIRRRLDRGGVMVVPAAPALATIKRDVQYYMALKESSFAIFDSGFLCLLLRVFKGLNVRKLSGLTFLRNFLGELPLLDRDTVFLIDPSHDDSTANRALLNRLGYEMKASHQYIAPIYSSGCVEDAVLINVLNSLKPKFIIVNLGGGVQEKLAVYLAKRLDYVPAIICTGAAIAFLTGRQATISPLFDRAYLGWLSRCLCDPRRFVPRYWSGIKLLPMIFESKVRENHS